MPSINLNQICNVLSSSRDISSSWTPLKRIRKPSVEFILRVKGVDTYWGEITSQKLF